jgi:high affinity cGMP-specific 3',5'-cyclic phosphodiesterase 9
MGFIKFVLIPMFECFAKIFPQITDLMVKPLYDAYQRYEQMKIQEESSTTK